MSDERDILARAAEFDAETAEVDVPAALRSLASRVRRDRKLIVALALSLILDIALSVGLGLVAVRANNAARVAASTASVVRSSCMAANDSRKGQLQLWHFVLSFPSPTPRTPEQELQYHQFASYVDSLFAPRNCTAEADKIRKSG